VSALLTVSDVDHTYPDGTAALDGVSLRVAPGEFVSVVGPSGCGKSTLLRLAAGLLTPSAGTVERGAGSLGYVFQDPTLLPWRTVRRNVELAAELHRLPRAERRSRAESALDRVGLAGFAGARPGTLSGGMRMRVSLARALALRPDLFLFDEPFGALDEITRSRLGADLEGLFRADGFGALFITHSVVEAVTLSDRVLVMSARPGRLLAEVEIPLERPRARFGPEFGALAEKVSTALRGEE
jgi:NitT/TauT family transport system ATP-binding protein